MFVPFISEPSVDRRKLWRRKGGGGGGRGGGGGGGRGGGSSSSGGSGGGRGPVTSVSSSGGSRGVSTFSQGGGRPTTITSGPFQGRSQGGGTRNDIYGSRTYGSGYPGTPSRGTAGLGFPFIFWPLSFGALGAAGGYHYLSHNEYGNPNDENRPGGPQTVASISPPGGGGGGGGEANNGTFYLLSDRESVEALKPILAERCGTFIENKDNIATQRYNGTLETPPRPEQVIQYYRGSTAALALEGYNNTAALSEDGGAPDVPLPTNINTDLLNCLNSTIAEGIPLEDNAGFSNSPAPLAIFTIFGIFLAFM